jgi:hypothetical protein
VRSIRRWLTDNRIYFETLAALSLVAMAAFVIVQAKRIADIQERAARAQGRPAFAVAYRVLTDDAAPSRQRDELLIVNAGGPAPGLSHELATLFRVVLGPPGFPKTAYIPVLGYYCSAQVTAEVAGPPFTYGACDDAEPNAVRAARLSRGFADLAERNNLAGVAEIVRFARVSYEDALGGLRSEYFLARPQGACPLYEQDGRLLFAFHDHLVRSLTLPAFAQLTPRDLYDEWSLIINDERNSAVDSFRCATPWGFRIGERTER